MTRQQPRPSPYAWLWAELERRFGAEVAAEIKAGYLKQNRAHGQARKTMTPLEQTEYHIRLRNAHPRAFFALMKLNEEIDALRARLPPEAFAALQAESRRAVAERQTKASK